MAAVALILLLSTLSSGSSLAPRRLPAKYFSEPGGSLALFHYDARFFAGAIPYEEHQDVLRGLIRSYLATMAAHGAETWLAHGTLLGWWWNAQAMPWDYDIDVQLTYATMAWLAANLNATEHVYAGGGRADMSSPADDEVVANRTYLLDINPHYSDQVTRGDINNMIDGRWIDTQNGMFIDITVLRERNKRFDPGVWSCKNRHYYLTRQLWPLRLTEFEGVPALVPYEYENILVKEYSRRALKSEWHEQ